MLSVTSGPATVFDRIVDDVGEGALQGERPAAKRCVGRAAVGHQRAAVAAIVDDGEQKLGKANRVVASSEKSLRKNDKGWGAHRPAQLCQHLGRPAVAVNNVLQGSFGRAWTTTQRFAINSTVGGLGVFDVATDWDRPGHRADFGQTLGVWGMGPESAVQLPLFGPSNARDSVAQVVGLVTDPTMLASGGAATPIRTASGGVGVVDGRANFLGATDSLEKTSLDYCATLRSLSAQKRAAFVAKGRAGGAPDGNASPH